MLKAFYNQTTMMINKTPAKDENFCLINKNVLQEVISDLSNGAFKVYMCLAQHSHGYEAIFTRKNAEEIFGIKEKQYRLAIQELIEKGYLIPGDGRKNAYIFHDHP